MSLRKALPWMITAACGAAALPAAAIAIAAIDWNDWVNLERRQAILIRVGAVADRLHLPSTIGCALRRHAGYLDVDDQVRLQRQKQAAAAPAPKAEA